MQPHLHTTFEGQLKMVDINNNSYALYSTYSNAQKFHSVILQIHLQQIGLCNTLQVGLFQTPELSWSEKQQCKICLNLYLKVLDCIGRPNRGREVQNFATEYNFLQGTLKRGRQILFSEDVQDDWYAFQIQQLVWPACNLLKIRRPVQKYRQPVQRFKNRFDVLMLESRSES